LQENIKEDKKIFSSSQSLKVKRGIREEEERRKMSEVCHVSSFPQSILQKQNQRGINAVWRWAASL
jgi:hypothetical protein